MRRAARTDRNHQEVIAALRKVGATAFSLHAVGTGFPDIIAGFRGVNILIEVKDGSRVASEQRITSDQKTFIESWAGQVTVVKSAEEAVYVVLEAARPGSRMATEMPDADWWQKVARDRPGGERMDDAANFIHGPTCTGCSYDCPGGAWKSAQRPALNAAWIQLAAAEIEGDPSCLGNPERIADIIRGHMEAAEKKG
jgi:hypothetical protein